MSLVNRLLDTFFRALDVVDVARDRLDRALGRATRPEPWTPTPLAEPPQPPVFQVARGANSTEAHAGAPPGARDDFARHDGIASNGAASSARTQRTARAATGGAARVSAKGEGKAASAARTGGSKGPKAARAAKAKAEPAARSTRSGKAAKDSKATKVSKATKATAAQAPSSGAAKTDARRAARSAPKKAPGSNRKGSVDRSGKDLDSPRAKAVFDTLRERNGKVIVDDAALEGKRVTARVLWALAAAEEAGSELGLTAADASALLHLAAGMEVFSTNVARACRDERTLVEETAPDGRSKRYRLTAAGRQAAASLPTRPMTST